MPSKPCYRSLIFVSAILIWLGACQQNPQPTAKAPAAEQALRDAVDAYISRYTLSSRNKSATNADGSVDLYLQADSPGKANESNWLPAPKAKFVPMLRLYWPKETPPSIIDGTGKPPAIKKVQ